MNINQVQDILSNMPDQQINAFAQGQNPQVPQVLAQMELMRRANLRKAQVMNNDMRGGMESLETRGFAKGGLAVDATPAYGKRHDGTEKGSGFLGELATPDGGVMTENSIGVDFGQGEVEIPTIVPTLSEAEIKHLTRGGEPTQEIIDKAVQHAQQRISQGLSPFADNPTSGGLESLEPRGFAKGGLTVAEERYQKRQAKEDELLESAKRKRSAQMNDSSIFSTLLNPMPGLRMLNQGIKDAATGGLGMLIPDAVKENYHRQQMLRDPEYAAQENARIAAEQQQAQATQAAAQSANSVPSDLRGPVGTPVSTGGASGTWEASPTTATGATPPAQIGSTPGTQTPPSVAPTTGVQRVSSATKATDSSVLAAKPTPPGDADKGLGSVASQSDQMDLASFQAQVDAEAAQMAKLVGEKGEILAKGMPDAPDTEGDRNQAFYRALTKFGATLATTGILAQAGDAALAQYQSDIASSKEKMAEFKKAALEIGLKQVDVKLQQAGYAPAAREKFRNEVIRQQELEMKRMDAQREDKKIGIMQQQADTQEFSARSTAKYQQGSLAVQKANLGARTTVGGKPLSEKDRATLLMSARQRAEQTVKAEDSGLGALGRTPEQRASRLNDLATQYYNDAVTAATTQGTLDALPGSGMGYTSDMMDKFTAKQL